jgi:hypothetical protein
MPSPARRCPYTGGCSVASMLQEQAERLVELLRARGVFAHTTYETVAGVGLRVVLGDGREAIWDADGAAGLEAMVMRDGMLVGYVPAVADSDAMTDEQVADVIAGADYGAA